jgi:membrane-associated phospholipid phosphatase
MSNSSKYHFPIQGIKVALWTFIIFILIGIPFLFFPKENFTLWLNAKHSPFLDNFFYYATHIGDGLMFIPVFLLLLYRNYVLSAFFAVFVALEALIVQVLLKKGIFAHLNRPPGYIENFDQLYQIPGVELNYMHTFPSGHTQSAFLMAFFLVLLFQNHKYLQILFPTLAVLVGLSRIYLLKHFFVDVWVGAIIGFILPYFTILILQKKNKFSFSTKGLKDNIFKNKR